MAWNWARSSRFIAGLPGGQPVASSLLVLTARRSTAAPARAARAAPVVTALGPPVAAISFTCWFSARVPDTWPVDDEGEPDEDGAWTIGAGGRAATLEGPQRTDGMNVGAGIAGLSVRGAEKSNTSARLRALASRLVSGGRPHRHSIILRTDVCS